MKLPLVGAALILFSCSTPEFDAAKSSCSAVWQAKIPSRFEQEMYNMSQSRQVPSGMTSCTGYGYSMICNQTMRTEYYTIPAVRTVDRNKPQRDAQINACTQNLCMKKYGNAECKPSKS